MSVIFDGVKTSVIFNYFNPKQSPVLLRTATFALESLLRTTGNDCEIICADGSGVVSDTVAAQAGGVARMRYEPVSWAESFAETYNRGASLALGDVLVLCASDVVFTAPWLDELTRPLAGGVVAMTSPYLSHSDYIAQCYWAPVRRTTFEPCCMTINVNAVGREVWEKVGPLDPSFTGNYNDIDWLIRLRMRGLKAAIVDCGLITHLGGATLGTSSLLRAEQDRATFATKHPALATDVFWHRCWHPLLCRSALFRLTLRGAMRTAPRERRWLRVVAALRWEPLFHRIKAGSI